MKKKIYFSLVVLISLIILTILMNKKNEDIVVKLHNVKRGDITRYINTTAIVKSKYKKEYYLDKGKVIDIPVHIGLEVEKGDTLVNSELGKLKADDYGTVTEINIINGEYANPQLPAIVIQNLKNLKLTANINKNDIKDMGIGQKVIVKDNSDKDIIGKISFIAPVAKVNMNYMDGEGYIEIDIDELESNGGLIVGFKNEIEILIGEKKEIIAIPVEALKLEKGNKNIVYVVKDGIVDKHEVVVGLQGENYVEITEGINEGDKVILNPLGNLTSGDKVKSEG